ncbi:MAG: MFS transporter, partial [Candidatus Nanopelagicales bacterium]|nr:MFS transporter [Candidatus Nanopelagicales bacterium]
MSAGRHWIAKMRVDVSPLRTSRGFRLLFASGLVTYLGSMITYVALPFQIAQLTGSYLAVGAIGLAELLPLVIFGLYGGALADTVDRRIMAIATEATMGVLVTVLLVNALLPHPHVWVIYVVAMVLAAADG